MTTPQQPRNSSGGGWVILIIIGLALILWGGKQVMQVTQCNTMTQTCTQTDYPVTTNSP